VFDIGFGEVVLCCIVALIVFGPEKLPGLLRDLAALKRRIQAVMTQAKTSLEKELNTLDDPASKSRDP
jgi:sec-independent protein translocase protein TatB